MGSHPSGGIVLLGSSPSGELSWWEVVLVGNCPGGVVLEESCPGVE